MRKLFTVLFIAVLFCAVSSAQTVTGAHSTVQVADLTLVDWSAGQPWTTILGHPNRSNPNSVLIKLSEQKELLFSVSLECGLYTQTLVKSSGGTKDTSSAQATVQVRVLVDGNTATPAFPGAVTFCDRFQQLSAKLQGIIENLACFVDDDNDATTPPVFDPDAPGCILTLEEIELVLRTLNANAFFFILPDVGVGTHNIEVQARIATLGSAQLGSWDAKALIGKGAVVVENHRLAKGDNIVLQP